MQTISIAIVYFTDRLIRAKKPRGAIAKLG